MSKLHQTWEALCGATKYNRTQHIKISDVDYTGCSEVRQIPDSKLMARLIYDMLTQMVFNGRFVASNVDRLCGAVRYVLNGWAFPISGAVSQLPFARGGQRRPACLVNNEARYLATTVANSRETNKQPQLKKHAQNLLMIYYHQYHLFSIINTNKWACNVLNWNHSFIWKAKTHLQSPVSRLWLERYKRRKTQELQKRSCNIATYL